MTPTDGSPSALERIEKMTKQTKEAAASRRRFIAGTAAAGAGIAGLAGPTAAGVSQEGNESDSSGSQQSGGDEPSNVEVLNYALTLEHLEYEFYEQGLDEFSASEMNSAEALCQNNTQQNEQVYERLTSIRDHEKAHVDTISQVIEQLGGDPVGAACYEFGYSSPSEFLGIAAVLETTGVSAYTGALKFFNNDDLATAGATIATVEGRHSAYLNDLNGKSPFPRAFDEAKPMDQILEAAGQFIVECEDGSGSSN